MCGIIGYAGCRDAKAVLEDGLKRLEYRGYDSAGIALFCNDKIKVIKSAGKVLALSEKLKSVDTDLAVCGIGHTRWATHGAPTDINSHPHSHGRITLVHNGIIENYKDIKGDTKTISDTDTEAAAILINSLYDGDPIKAIADASIKMHGSFALCIMFEDIKDTIFAVRRDSPLAIGIGENETVVASDIPAIIPYTDRYCLLNEGEIAKVDKNGAVFYDINKNIIEKPLKTAHYDLQNTDKNGFEHYMLKEIFEQPTAIKNTVAECQYELEKLNLGEIDRIYIVACGSAMHAGLLGAKALEKLCDIPTRVYIASEFRYDGIKLRPTDLVIAVSQSGETADTLAALRLAKKQGAKTLGIVNVFGSALDNEADFVLHTRAGVEICVATTKAYLCQSAVMYMLALKLSGNDLSAMQSLEQAVKKALNLSDKCKFCSHILNKKEHAFFIGRGVDYSVCTEGSLKLKEVSYLHSEAYPAGELKHGTISLIENGTPLIAVMTDRKVISKTISNIKEAVARGAKVIAVTYPDIDVSDFCDNKIEIDVQNEWLAPIVAAVPLQLLAYYTAKSRGCDIDKPRNLAKSVTVE